VYLRLLCLYLLQCEIVYLSGQLFCRQSLKYISVAWRVATAVVNFKHGRYIPMSNVFDHAAVWLFD